MTAAPRLGIIVNPRHLRSHRVYSRLTSLLRTRSIRYRTMTTTREWAGGEQTRALVEWGSTILLVLGGDGTLREAAPVAAAAGTPVLIVPTGTANVMARAIGICGIRTALDLLDKHLGGAAATARVPVNEAEYLDAEGVRHHGRFLSMAGIGGDAEAVAGIELIPGLLGYIAGGTRALFSRGVRIDSIVSNDEPMIPRTRDTHDARRHWAIMASKLSHPAGPIEVFPGASPFRADFEFLALEIMGAGSQAAGSRIVDWAALARDFVMHRPGDNPAAHFRNGTELTVRLSEPGPVHLDGDSIGPCRELSVRAGSDGLQLLVPVDRPGSES